ncbi:MAG: DNA translocase FtsK 4TM domain-containing protein [Clostridia bacterium]|nr:DNA translocase FtsK 4TM domain-containing protein [Clostridia bacterium]
MGRKKGSKNRKGRTKKAAKTIGNDMLGGILIVVGIMLFVLLTFSNIGFLSNIVKSVLKGLLGNLALGFPFVLIIVGAHCIMSDEQVMPSKEIIKGTLLVVLVASTLCSFASSNLNFFDNTIKYVVDSYNMGVLGANMGGISGMIIAGLCYSVMGGIASKVLLLLVTFIATLLVFDISFNEFFVGVKNVILSLCNFFVSSYNTLFRKAEYEDAEKLDDDLSLNGKKLSKKQRLEEERRQKELAERMKEKGSLDPGEKLKTNNVEQIEFDFNKLGGKPSEAEIEGKQKRDEFFKMQREEKEDKNVKEVLTLDHTKHVEEENYIFPPITLLNEGKGGAAFDRKAIHATAIKLQKTLASFGVEAKVTNITKGPTVTRYELTPSTGVKVSKIVNLSDDIALNLAAKSIRIEAPIPGKAAVGIEVPNEVAESVSLREVIESDAFNEHSSKLAFALGKNAAGEIVVGDIAKMPHVLIAGATGSGKSVCINSLIVSILYKAKPSEVKMILVDPKMVELSGYNGIPHLLIPVVTDPKKAAGALNWAVQEMVNRYNLFASKGVKDIKGYNKLIEKEEGVKLPQIVIIIDELADLMMVAPNDVEDAICRLAQMARAAGMHLVIATQRPSVDVITGIIKANIPSRIAFTVSSQVDSRTILDMAGAEKLLGKGDMLYYPTGETKPLRIQGAFISEKEIEEVVENIKSNVEVQYSEDIIESIEKGATKGKESGEEEAEDADPILNEAIDLVMNMGQASASMLQRKFKIGYSRAGRIVDQMEARGLISGYDGSKPRQVLISKEEWQELKMGASSSSATNNEEANDSQPEVLQEENAVLNPPQEQHKRSSIDIEL